MIFRYLDLEEHEYMEGSTAIMPQATRPGLAALVKVKNNRISRIAKDVLCEELHITSVTHGRDNAHVQHALPVGEKMV